MPLKKSSDVPLIRLDQPLNQAHLFKTIASALALEIPELTPSLVAQLVMAREREGETYIGHGVVILHLISELVARSSVLLVKAAAPLSWRSRYSGATHQVDKFVVLAIAPDDVDGAQFRPIMRQLIDEASIRQLFEME